MPIYEFECKKCKGRFELLCRMGESAEGVSCALCGNREVRKLMSGFYARGSGNGGGKSCVGCSSRSCSGCH